MSRVTASIAVGVTSALLGGIGCAVGAATVAALYAVSALYCRTRCSVLEKSEVWTTGLASTIAGYILGVYLGSALAG
jgi:hypothetical protein